jgi:uncharacterized membrane protein YkvA (DUF1232 family)
MDKDEAKKFAKSKFLKAAKEIVRNPKQALHLLDEVEEKLKGDYFKSTFKGIFKDLKLLFGLLRAFFLGQYKDISKENLALIILGLLYFLNPLDFIPDLLVGGFLDDVFIMGWVIRNVREELEKYEEWRSSQK